MNKKYLYLFLLLVLTNCRCQRSDLLVNKITIELPESLGKSTRVYCCKK